MDDPAFGRVPRAARRIATEAYMTKYTLIPSMSKLAPFRIRAETEALKAWRTEAY